MPVVFLIPWTEGMTTTLLADIGLIITDLSPLLVPIIAIGLGLMILAAIINAIRG